MPVIDLKQVTDGNRELFASAGRKAVDYSEYLPVLKLSAHAKDIQGNMAIKAFPCTWGEFAVHTRGLRWAAEHEGLSVATRWQPQDPKRHAAVLQMLKSAPESPELNEKLSELPGMCHFRTMPKITRRSSTTS